MADLVRREKAVKAYARFNQYLFWPVFFVAFHSFFRLRVRGRDNFRAAGEPLVVVANHLAFYDGFLLRLIIGFRAPHLPLRFMGVKKFNWPWLNFLARIGVIDLVYWIFGVFTVVLPSPVKGRNLIEAENILKAQGTVVMYPEGSIAVAAGVGPFKKGAAVLAINTGADVVPVAFRLGKRHLFRRELTIEIGKAMRHSILIQDGETVEAFTRRLQAAVAGLYSESI